MTSGNNVFGYGPGNTVPSYANDFTVLGNLHVLGTSQLDGAVTTGSTLTSDGVITGHNGLFIDSGATILSGATTVDNSLEVLGLLTTDNGINNIGGLIYTDDDVHFHNAAKLFSCNSSTLFTNGLSCTTKGLSYDLPLQGLNTFAAYSGIVAIDPTGVVAATFSSFSGSMGTFTAPNIWTVPSNGVYMVTFCQSNFSETAYPTTGGRSIIAITFNDAVTTIAVDGIDGGPNSFYGSVPYTGCSCSFVGLLGTGNQLKFWNGIQQDGANNMLANAKFEFRVAKLY